MIRILSLPLLLALAACTADRVPHSAPPPSDSAAAPATDALGGYHWRLREAVDADGTRIDALFADPDRPLQLDFVDGRVGVSGGCNRMGGRYTLRGDALQIGELEQTLMACENTALMDQDTAIHARLHGSSQLRIEESAPPTLVLATAGGDRLRFEGEATADTRYGGPGETVFLEIAAQRASCSHPLIPDMQCLQVREVRYDAQGLKSGEPGDWQPLYQEIEGYTHEPGVRNVLRVKRYQVPNPPADASSIAYVLDMVVESELVQP